MLDRIIAEVMELVNLNVISDQRAVLSSAVQFCFQFDAYPVSFFFAFSH